MKCIQTPSQVLDYKRLVCMICKSVNHLKCAYPNTTARSLYDSEAKQWTCSYCTLSCLPFHSLRSLDELVGNNLNTHNNSYAETNVHLQCLQQFSNHTSICHLNTQSMCSTFDEFYVMCNTCKYDIITLSETWLKNNHHLIEHVQIPGYQLDYRNRDNTRGGGMGVYIKEHIKFKRRHDIEKIVDSFEHMWFEFSGKNK